MIHDHYIIIKLQQNVKNHRPKNKIAPSINKKQFFYFKKINNTKSPLKGENLEGWKYKSNQKCSVLLIQKDFCERKNAQVTRF
jgi:hypothetical protein